MLLRYHMYLKRFYLQNTTMVTPYISSIALLLNIIHFYSGTVIVYTNNELNQMCFVGDPHYLLGPYCAALSSFATLAECEAACPAIVGQSIALLCPVLCHA